MYWLYSKVLRQLAGQAIDARYSPQFGHVPGHVPGRQANEVVFILRRMVEQANGADTNIRDGLRRRSSLRPRLAPPDH